MLLQHARESSYRDPLIDFVECLYQDFDVDRSEDKLRECEAVLASDFFLHQQLAADFMENARIFMFETYCRLHEKIELKMLAKKLAMDGPEAEQWIVDLIRNARLDAKINSKDGFIIMGTTCKSNNVYQQIVDKTRELAARTCNLALQLDSNATQRR